MSFKAPCIILPELQPAEFILLRPDRTIDGIKSFYKEPGFFVWRPFTNKGRNRTGKGSKGKFKPQQTLEIVGLNGQHLVINTLAEKYSVEGSRKQLTRLSFSWGPKDGPVTVGDFPVFLAEDGHYYKIARPFRFSSDHLLFDLYRYDPFTQHEELVGIKTMPDISIY